MSKCLTWVHRLYKMGRNAKASSSKLPTRPVKEGRKAEKIPVPREPESEAESASDDEEVDEDDLLGEMDEEEEEGIAQYAPDDWDGEDDGASDSGSGTGSEEEDASASESEDEGKEDLVCPPSIFNLDTDKQRKLQENLRSMPLQTLMKAQRSLQNAPESEAGSSSVKAKRLAEAKKQLAEMQRRKGKATAIVDDLEDEDGSEDEFEDLRRSKGRGGDGEGRKEKVKRDNKHA